MAPSTVFTSGSMMSALESPSTIVSQARGLAPACNFRNGRVVSTYSKSLLLRRRRLSETAGSITDWISGRWTSEPPARNGAAQASTYTFNASGAALTGRTATPGGAQAIRVVGSEIRLARAMAPPEGGLSEIVLERAS
jgi:hypothetical protein